MILEQLASPEAERLILGSILVDESKLDSLQALIRSDHFFLPAHRQIFSAFTQLRSCKRPINTITLMEVLRSSNGKSEDVVTAVAGLTGEARALADPKPYAEMVVEKARVRFKASAIAKAAEAIDKGSDPDVEATVLRGILESVHEPGHIQPEGPRFERIGEDRYRLIVAGAGITFEVDRLRREHNELIGELAVRCDLAGARTYDGSLSVADFNLSSARARTERGRLLADRSKAEALDWQGYLEEFCQRVLLAERTGDPAVDLKSIAKPAADDELRVGDLKFPRRHPSFIFGDGGALKTYLAEYIAGELSNSGIPTAIFDWEMTGEDHRERLERIYNPIMMPKIAYVRCERPLVYEADRLRKVVAEWGIQYAVYDSVTFACDGPPEAAESAARYFRAVREIGVGGLHVAHISKSDGADQKPFGSVFWHNGARATFFAQKVDASRDGHVVTVGLFNRKSNCGRIQKPTGFKVEFVRGRTFISKCDPKDTPELAEKMPIRWRLLDLLMDGPVDIKVAAESLDAEADTVRRTIRRYKNQFVVLKDGKVAILQRDTGADKVSGQ